MVERPNSNSELPHRFEQQRQQVGTQFNAHSITFLSSIATPHKLEPEVQQIPYRLDRQPQCTALRNHLSQRPATGHPLCVIAMGTDYDLPDAFAATLFDFMSRALAKEFCIRDFFPPPRPLCREWPVNASDPETLWGIVGNIFLGQRALQGPKFAREALSNLPKSIAFGFCLDMALWDRHAAVLREWISSLRACAAHPATLVLAVVLINSSLSDRAALEDLQGNLSSYYKDNPDVLVLPTLGPVTKSEFRQWRQYLLDDMGSRLLLEELETLALDVFPGALSERRIGEIWDVIVRRIHSAWIHDGP